MPDLLYKREGHIASLILNRPEQRNAFSDQMISEWREAIEEASRDDQVRAVVVTGNGKAFCAGGDLAEIHDTLPKQDPITRKNYLWKQIQRIPMALQELDKPIIAAVNGPAIGAGCDMAIMCDIRLASSRAVFAESYILVGLVPGDGGAYFLPRLVGVAKACEMLFTGDTISAEEAERIGLVNRVVPDDQLLEQAYTLAEKIAARPPISVQLTKRLIYQGLETNRKTALDLASSFMSHILPLEETQQAVLAMMEKMGRRRP